jgi:hypothetical protein
MFIKKLYRHSKMGCFAFVAFIMAFIFINYKWGVVATPLLQYGMFSGKSYLKDTQAIYIIEANHKIIDCAKISLAERDMLQVYPDYYEKQSAINQITYTTMKKYMRYSGLFGLMNIDKFTNKVTDSIFTNWYKLKVEKIINEPVLSLSVFKQHFLWQQTRLVPIDNPLKLSYIVP